MAWWDIEDSEIERRRLQSWQQLKLALVMQANPFIRGFSVYDAFNVWFWKRAVLANEHLALKRRLLALKQEQQRT